MKHTKQHMSGQEQQGGRCYKGRHKACATLARPGSGVIGHQTRSGWLMAVFSRFH